MQIQFERNILETDTRRGKLSAVLLQLLISSVTTSHPVRSALPKEGVLHDSMFLRHSTRVLPGNMHTGTAYLMASV